MLPHFPDNNNRYLPRRCHDETSSPSHFLRGIGGSGFGRAGTAAAEPPPAPAGAPPPPPVPLLTLCKSLPESEAIAAEPDPLGGGPLQEAELDEGGGRTAAPAATCTRGSPPVPPFTPSLLPPPPAAREAAEQALAAEENPGRFSRGDEANATPSRRDEEGADRAPGAKNFEDLPASPWLLQSALFPCALAALAAPAAPVAHPPPPATLRRPPSRPASPPPPQPQRCERWTPPTPGGNWSMNLRPLPPIGTRPRAAGATARAEPAAAADEEPADAG